MQRLPVFLLRVKSISILLNDFRRILYVGLRPDQPHQALDVDLRVDDDGKRLHDKLDRLHHAERVGHEDGDRADPHHVLHREVAAVPEHDRERDHRHHRDAGSKQRAVVRRAHARPLHVVRVLLEVFLDAVRDDERPDRAGARDALVEVARDLGVDLADAAVQGNELFLEVGDEDHDDRHEKQQKSRHLPVDEQHHDEREQDVGEIPDEVHDLPGQDVADAGRVAHDARVDVADVVRVEVRERQRLQVVEAQVLQIARDVDLDLAAQVDAEDVHERLREHHRKVQC